MWTRMSETALAKALGRKWAKVRKLAMARRGHDITVFVASAEDWAERMHRWDVCCEPSGLWVARCLASS